MAGTKISELPVATALTGAELVPVVQSGATKQTTLAQMPYVPAGTGAVTTTVQAKLRETVSVKDFGAVGDGVADDTAAIQAALNAGVGKIVYLPSGDYLISSKLLIPAQTGLCGEIPGIGTGENRGATLVAALSLSDYILENKNITASPSDPWWHGGHVEGISFRNKGGGTASGFNVGPCGDSSVIKHCKFYYLVTGLKVGGTATNLGVQVSCNLDSVTFYGGTTGLLFQQCTYTAAVKNLMLDGCATPVRFQDCGGTFHCSVDRWHAENLPTATEIFYVNNCNGSFIEIGAGSAETGTASATISVVRSDIAAAKIRVGNVTTTVGANYILKDDLASISWTRTQLGPYAEVAHNYPVVPSGTSGIKFNATQVSSSDANTLDDYEEGTYTATVTPQTSGSITLSATVDTMAYTKIGRLVHVQGYIKVASVSSPVGGFVLVSLPFAAADITEYAGVAGASGVYTKGASSTVVPVIVPEAASAATVLNVTVASIAANDEFYLSFSYISAT